jgi:Tol biopolymer transport system component
MDADGGSAKALTNDGHSHTPSWSPDAQQILFIHDSSLRAAPIRNDKSHYPVELYVMNRDGSDAHLLRRLEPFIGNAVWSRDGKALAVNLGRRVFLLAPDGQGEPHLLFPNAFDPSWSPDGRRVVFTALVPDSNPLAFLFQTPIKSAIYVANSDDSMETQLTDPDVMTTSPTWSPDGRQIAFESEKQVFVMNQDGSGERQITNDPDWAWCRHPSWSPDGKRLAIACYATSAPCGNYFAGIGAGIGRESHCVRRIIVISVQAPPKKLVPIMDHDGASPAFAPVGQRVEQRTFSVPRAQSLDDLAAQVIQPN